MSGAPSLDTSTDVENEGGTFQRDNTHVPDDAQVSSGHFPIVGPGGSNPVFPVGQAPAADPSPQEEVVATDQPKAPPPSYDELATGLVAEQARQDEQLKKFTAYRTTHTDTAPDKQREVLEYAAAADVDPQFAQDNLDELKKTVDLHVLAGKLQAAPALAKFMADAAHGPLVKDDAANLSTLEWALGRKWEFAPIAGNPFLVVPTGAEIGPAPVRAFRDALRQQDYINLANKEAEGRTLSDDEQKQLVDLESKYGGERDYGANNLLTKGVIGLAKMSPYLAGDVASTAAGATAGTIVAGAAGIETGPGEAVIAPAGAVTGGAAGAFTWNFFQNFGPQYRSLRKMTDENGQPLLSEAEARTLAITASTVGAGAMTLAGAGLLAKAPGMDKVFGKIGLDAVSRAVTQQTVRRTILMAPVKAGITAASGGIAMAAQAAANAGAEEFAKGSHGMEAQPTRVADAAWQAFTKGTEGMSLLIATGAGREFLGDLGRAKAFEQDTLAFQAEADAAAKSKLLDRDPDKFQDLHRLAQGDNPQARHIDVGAWDRYWEGKKVSPGDVAARVMGDDGAAYREAASTGGSLAIPAEKFMASFGKTEHIAGLRDDLRFTADGVSLNEARARLEDLAEKAKTAGNVEAPEDDGAATVARDMAQKGVAAGVEPKVADAVGSLWGAAFRNLGKATGVRADEAYQNLVDVRVNRGEGRPREEDASFDFGESAPIVEPSKEALDFIDRMRPANREAAQAFLEYAQGKSEKRPAISDDLEKSLARYGIVDPKGYGFDQNGRRLDRPLPGARYTKDGRRRGNVRDALGRVETPAGLKSHRDNSDPDSYLGQPPGPSEGPEASSALGGHFSKLDVPGRAEDIYRDHATGLLNETALKELPKPAGKRLALFEFGNVKAVNDHPEFGGHEIADGAYRMVGNELAKLHPQVFKDGGRFAAYVKDDAEAQGIRNRVNKVLGDKDFALVSATGETKDEAVSNINARKDQQRAKGQYPDREKPSEEFLNRLPSLKFTDERAKPEMPKDLVEAAGTLSDKDAFEKGYVEKETGLLTAKGWNLIPRKKFVVSLDLRGLKAANDRFGTKFGDNFLSHFGEWATAHGGADFDLAHRSGDEYLAQSNDRDEITSFLDGLKERLQGVPLTGRDKVTGETAPVYVNFRHGVGEGEHAELQADRALNKQRADEKAGKATDVSRRVGEGSGKDGSRLGDRRPPAPELEEPAGRPQAYPGSSDEEVNKLGQPGRPVHPELAAALATHEEKIRSEPNEHAAAFAFDGQPIFTHTSGHENRVELTPSQGNILRYSGDAIFTHNHPGGSMLSADDLALAFLVGLREMRAVEPDGTIWRVERPQSGWGYRAGHAAEWDDARESLLARQRLALASAKWSMDGIVKQAGGDPSEFRNAKGYTNEAWKKLVNEELVKQFNGLAEVRGLDWRIERIDPGTNQNREAGAGQFDSRLRAGEVKLFQPPEGGSFRLEKDGDRGFVTFGPPEGGKPRRFNIHILESADPSTFAHETFHVLSEVMGDVATQEGAPEQLKKDYQTLLEWMGHANHEERQAHAEERRQLAALGSERTPDQDKRLKQLTAKEERATHAWEQYLMEGKSPSLELAGVFTRFRRWLTGIYRGISNIGGDFARNFGEPLSLTDDVRGVFDRMLASEDEVKRAQDAVDASTPFRPAMDHMTEAERAEYEKVTGHATTEAEDELRRRIVQAQRGENVRWMREEREKTQAQVEGELDQDRTYRTVKVLQGGDELLGDLKLDRAAAVRKFGKDAVAALPRGIFAPKGGGKSADEAAAVLGWNDAREMIDTLGQAQPRAQVVREQVQQRMEERFGPSLLDDPQGLASAAMDAVHSPAQARRTILELNALRRALRSGAKGLNADRAAFQKYQEMEKAKGNEAAAAKSFEDWEAESKAASKAEDQKTEEAAAARRQAELRDELLHGWDPQAARGMAEGIVRGKTVGELTAGDRGLAGAYERAERTMAKRSLESATKGDLESAIALKERQLLNQELYRAARDRRAELLKASDKLDRATGDDWRAELGKADPSYRDASDAILQAIGKRAADPTQGRLGIEGFLAKAGADAQEIGFDPDAIRDLLTSPTAWEGLTSDQAQNVVDAVANIKHAANAINEVTIGGKKMSRDAYFQEVQAALVKNAEPIPPEPMSRTAAGRGPGRKAAHLLRGGDAILTDTENFAAMMDGGGPDGPVTRLLVYARLESRAKELELQNKVLEPIRKLWDAVPKDVRAMRDRVVDVDLPVPPGSESRIAPTYTRDNLWMLFLRWGDEGNRQRIRDGNGWDDAQVERALSKLSPEETDFLQGVLDGIESLRPELAAVYERRTGLPLGRVEASPITVNGKEYRGGYFPIKYDPRFSKPGAVQEADAVAQLFPQGYKTPYVASGHTKARMEKINAPVDLEWGNVPAHLAQVTHDIAYGDWVRQAGRLMLDQRWKDLTTQYLGPERAKEFVPWLRDVANARADSTAGAASAVVGEVSGIMRSRLAIGLMGLNLPTLAVHITDPLNAVTAGIRADRVAAAYPKVLSEVVRNWIPGLQSSAEGSSAPYESSSELAFRIAQHDGSLKKALVEMGPKGTGWQHVVNQVAFKLHELVDTFNSKTIFTAGYWEGKARGMGEEEAVQYADDMVRRSLPVSDVGDKARVLRTKSGTLSTLMFYGYASKLWNLQRRGFMNGPVEGAAKLLWLGMVGAGSAYLAGRGPEEDENKAKWLALKVALHPLNTVPWLGGVAESLVNGKKADVRAAPELAYLTDTLNRLHAAAKKAEDGDETAAERLWGGIQAIVGGLGPVKQAERTFGYANKLSTGEVQPRGPLDVASGLMYGKHAHQGANPLSTAQDLLSQ